MARAFCVDFRDAQNAAAGFGAGDEIALGVESQNANVRFVAGVKEFALAIGGDGEDLAFVTSGDVESSVGCECEVPDIFRLGIEENGFFAGSGDAVNLAISRSADLHTAFTVQHVGSTP